MEADEEPGDFGSREWGREAKIRRKKEIKSTVVETEKGHQKEEVVTATRG